MTQDTMSLDPRSVEPDHFLRRLDDAAVLAGRMAHDFDNLLMGVLGFAELALAQTPAGTTQHQYLAELYQVARRGTSVTQQMHDFSRGGRRHAAPSRLVDVWPGVLAGFGQNLAAGVSVQARIGDALPGLALAPEPLRLVLSHLTANAVEAMAEPGEVTVTARALTLEQPSKDFLPAALPAGEYVEMLIEDCGTGFRPDVLARLTMAPFTTTKVRHRGLGLAIVFRVLGAHGGGVRFEPAYPRGTRVTALLPTAAAATTALVR